MQLNQSGGHGIPSKHLHRGGMQYETLSRRCVAFLESRTFRATTGPGGSRWPSPSMRCCPDASCCSAPSLTSTVDVTVPELLRSSSCGCNTVMGTRPPSRTAVDGRSIVRVASSSSDTNPVDVMREIAPATSESSDGGCVDSSRAAAGDS